MFEGMVRIERWWNGTSNPTKGRSHDHLPDESEVSLDSSHPLSKILWRRTIDGDPVELQLLIYV